MRRLLSFTLLLLFSFPLFAPLFRSTAEENLPACCRRNGAHHCLGMSTMAASGQTLAIGAQCPTYPKNVAAVTPHPVFLEQSESCCAPVITHSSGLPHTVVRFRLVFSRARQKRGPPTILF